MMFSIEYREYLIHNEDLLAQKFAQKETGYAKKPLSKEFSLEYAYDRIEEFDRFCKQEFNDMHVDAVRAYA